jgi:hypothetical protein
MVIPFLAMKVPSPATIFCGAGMMFGVWSHHPVRMLPIAMAMVMIVFFILVWFLFFISVKSKATFNFSSADYADCADKSVFFKYNIWKICVISVICG